MDFNFLNIHMTAASSLSEIVCLPRAAGEATDLPCRLLLLLLLLAAALDFPPDIWFGLATADNVAVAVLMASFLFA